MYPRVFTLQPTEDPVHGPRAALARHGNVELLHLRGGGTVGGGERPATQSREGPGYTGIGEDDGGLLNTHLGHLELDS